MKLNARTNTVTPEPGDVFFWFCENGVQRWRTEKVAPGASHALSGRVEDGRMIAERHSIKEQKA